MILHAYTVILDYTVSPPRARAFSAFPGYTGSCCRLSRTVAAACRHAAVLAHFAAAPLFWLPLPGAMAATLCRAYAPGAHILLRCCTVLRGRRSTARQRGWRSPAGCRTRRHSACRRARQVEGSHSHHLTAHFCGTRTHCILRTHFARTTARARPVGGFPVPVPVPFPFVGPFTAPFSSFWISCSGRAARSHYLHVAGSHTAGSPHTRGASYFAFHALRTTLPAFAARFTLPHTAATARSSPLPTFAQFSFHTGYTRGCARATTLCYLHATTQFGWFGFSCCSCLHYLGSATACCRTAHRFTALTLVLVYGS